MDIQEKQAKWKQERPLFETAFIHSHLLPFFNFNENTGDYEIKSEYENDEDRALSFNVLNTGWAMWLRAKRDAKAQTDQKIKSLLCDEHLKKCESPTGIFNSQYSDEEPCLICLAKQAKAQAVPEGFVLVEKELPESIAETMALERVNKPFGETDPVWVEITEKVYKERLVSKKWELWRDYKDMIEAQEPAND